MNLKLAATGTLVFLLTGCVTPPENVIVANTAVSVTNKTTPILDTVIEKNKLSIRSMTLMANANRINKALSKLNNHVGKTWYVFSGNTPAGWDCSGLTMWFYEQLGIKLEHRASKQDTAGHETKDPNPGDIVIFKYKGSNDAYHVGIYVGDGKMIHAPKHGHVTRVEDVSTFGGNYSKITYRRIIESI